MPTVEIEISLRAIQTVGRAYLMHTRIRRAKLLIFSVHVEIVSAAKIILGARTANRGVIAIAVDIELNLALSPPAVAFNAPIQIGADVMSLALDIVKNNVGLHIRQRIHAAELRVEIQGILRKLLFLAIDLVINITFGSEVFDFDLKALEKRHFKIAIKPLCGINAHCKAR